MMRILFEADWRMAFASQAGRAQFEKLAGSAANRERYEMNLNKIGVNKIVYGYQEINAFLRSEGANIQCALLSFPHVANNLIPLITIHGLGRCRFG